MSATKKIAAWLDAIPYSAIALFLRVVAAHPFFVSGQTKIEGPTIGREIFGLDLTVQIPTAIRSATFALFADEYKLPFLSPNVAAYAATAIEVRAAPVPLPRAFDAPFRVRPPGDDDDHPNLRLSRRMVDRARLLGGPSDRPHRARAGSDLARPSDLPKMIAANADLTARRARSARRRGDDARHSRPRCESELAPPPLRSATSQFVELRPLVEAPPLKLERIDGKIVDLRTPSGKGRPAELLGDMVPAMPSRIADARAASADSRSPGCRSGRGFGRSGGQVGGQRVPRTALASSACIRSSIRTEGSASAPPRGRVAFRPLWNADHLRDRPPGTSGRLHHRRSRLDVGRGTRAIAPLCHYIAEGT